MMVDAIGVVMVLVVSVPLAVFAPEATNGTRTVLNGCETVFKVTE